MGPAGMEAEEESEAHGWESHRAAGGQGDRLPGCRHLDDPWRWQSGRQDGTCQPPEAPQASSPVVSSPLSLQGTGVLDQLGAAPGGRGVFGATGASEKEGILPHQLMAGSCQSCRRRISCSRKLTLAWQREGTVICLMDIPFSTGKSETENNLP